MPKFQQNMTALIGELGPKKAISTHTFYDFSQIEKANASELPYFLRVGLLYNNSIALPALVPFINSKGLVYLYNNADEESAKLYMQNLLFELIAKISPNKVDIVIYDPVYLGVPFRHISQVSLDNVSVELLTDEQHLLTRLQKYVQYSQEFISNKLLNYGSFIDYWVRSNDNQKQYTFFVLNDSNFIRNTAITDIINRITANTKNNNSFFILSDLDSRKSNFAFFNPEHIIENYTPFYDELYISLEYQNLKEKMHENLSVISTKQKEKPIQIDTFDIKEGIKFPIGVLKNNKPLNFQFGYDKAVYHAIIGGLSGKGKSNLLKVIIKQGFRHSPDELKYLLFDCFGSIDFKDFDNSPNVMVCERSGDIKNVVEKLKIIEQEFETRRQLMEEHNASTIEGLIGKGVRVPRLICIIDEFQYLFSSSDYKTSQYAEDLLVQKIIKGGRKFGIHLLVATQSLGDGVRRSILDNIPLRIALGMTEAQSNSFLAYNNDGAKNLDKYWAVYNDTNGEKDGNSLFKILNYDEL